MSVLQNINGSLYRMDASDLVQLAAVDTEGILGGTPGATTDGQTLVDQLAADDVQAQSDIGQIKTDLPNYLTIADEQVLGAWNTLKNDAATQTTEGATFTVNSDSTITINRPTATGVQAICEITKGGFVTETRKSGTYYLSGVPSGASGVTLQYYDQTTGDSWNDYGSGVQITVVKGHTIKIIARVAPSSTVSNVTVSPMIALKPNMPYVPYAMTNRELTEVKILSSGISATIISGNASVIYLYVRKCGNMVQLNFRVKASFEIAAGGTISASISGLPTPALDGNVVGINGAIGLIGKVSSSSKTIDIRIIGGALAANSEVYVFGNYLTKD